MAETSDSRGKDPMPSRRDPKFSHSPDGDKKKTAPPKKKAGSRLEATLKSDSWFRENLTFVVGIAATAAVLIVVLVLCWMAGFFGGPNSPHPQIADSQPAPAPAQATANPTTHTAQQAEPRREEPKTDVPKKEDVKKDEIPPLPDNVAKWSGKAGDYARARRENHPKLIEAVTRLGEKYPDSEPIARGLADLLKPLPPEKPPKKTPAVAPGTTSAPAGAALPPPRASSGITPSQPNAPTGIGPPPPSTPPNAPDTNPAPTPPAPPPHNPGDSARLVEAIVAALGRNGSATARETLEQILAGTFKTDDDKAAVEAAFKSLVANPSSEHDALLLRILTAPDELRPASRQGPWTARDMKDKTFELVKQSASSGLRTKLAAFLVKDHWEVDPKNPMGAFLFAPTPLNFGAQVAFYTKGNLGRDVAPTLEQQLTAFGSLALAQCFAISSEAISGLGGSGMGMPPPMFRPPTGSPSPTGEPAKTAENDLGAKIAQQLWPDEFRAVIERRLKELSTFEKQPNVVLLAATIPQDSTRAALGRALQKHWSEGPKTLEAAGLIDRVVTDPALLPLIKMGKRRESPNAPKASDVGKPGRGPRPLPPGGTGRSADAQKEAQAEQDWMDVSAKLVVAWCKRFAADDTAKTKDGEFRAAAKPADIENEPKLPGGFALRPGAKVLASRRIVLPDAAPPGFSQARPDSLEVYYVRAEETSKPKTVISHYTQQAQARSNRVRIFDKKTWIDSISVGSQKDRRRSIDVLITRPETAATAAGMSGDDEIDLIVEILIIEFKAPSKDS